MLAIPFGAYPELPRPELANKVVVNATNYYPDRDGHIPQLDSGTTTSSAYLAVQWPEAHVAKALNNVDYLRLPQLARPAGSTDRTALPIAADDPDSGAAVTRLLDSLGFDALDLGGLEDSWRSQPGTPIYVAPYYSQASEDPAMDPMQQFVNAAPVPVSLAQALALAQAATR